MAEGLAEEYMSSKRKVKFSEGAICEERPQCLGRIHTRNGIVVLRVTMHSHNPRPVNRVSNCILMNIMVCKFTKLR